MKPQVSHLNYNKYIQQIYIRKTVNTHDVCHHEGLNTTHLSASIISILRKVECYWERLSVLNYCLKQINEYVYNFQHHPNAPNFKKCMYTL